MKKVLFIAVAGSVLLSACGSATATTPKVAAPTVTTTVSAPAITTTVTPPAVTTTVAQTTTPQSCITALDIAVKVMEAVSTEHQEIGEAATKAADDGDIASFLESQTDAMNKMSDVVKESVGPMEVAATDCRASQK